jgi:SOS regulatory protein LexA
MDKKMTPKQQNFYMFLKDYISVHDQTPTFAEIKAQTHIKSNSTILHYLKKFEELRLISRSKRARGFKFVEELSFTTIQILGFANAGEPLVNSEEDDTLGSLTVDSRIIKNRGNLFAVKIKGDSMNKQLAPNKIFLNDETYAVVDKNTDFQKGDIVLASVNNSATVKIFHPTENNIILMPNSSNTTHHPIYIQDKEEFRIDGKVILALENPALK